MSRLACVWVPAFAAAAVERAEPALRERPLAIVTGTAPATRVVEANAPAREHGVRPGLADAEAGARCPGLVRRALSAEALAGARHALLEACLGVSPRLEDAEPGLVHLDAGGLQRLLGDETAIARRLLRQARAVGLEARVGVAASRAAARVAAHVAAPVRVIPAGQERAALAPVTIAALDWPAEVTEAFGRWGIATLGDLAALPRAGLAMRLGPFGLLAHDLACGVDREPFRLWTPPPFWEEAQGLEWEIDSLEALVQVLAGVLRRLAARLAAAHLWADALDVRLALAGGAHHARAVPMAAPTGDAASMLALLAHALEGHPPAAAVTAVAVSAHVVPRRAIASRLWQPPAPTVRDLATVLTRLATLVGPANVGTPVLADSHRPDAHTLAPFTPPADTGARATGSSDAAPASESAAPLVLRRLRPPRQIEVECDGERPRVVRGALSAHAAVRGAAGPWRSSGEWWDERTWARDEWDVALADGALCRLAHDRLAGAWYLDGVYD